MKVNHGGGNIAVPQQVLHGSDIDAAFQQVGCETVAEGVASRSLGKASLPHRFLELALHGGIV